MAKLHFSNSKFAKLFPNFKQSVLTKCTKKLVLQKFSFTDLSHDIVNELCILRNEGTFAGKEAEAVPPHQALVAGIVTNNVS